MRQPAPPRFDLARRTALVTGGSRGIGRAIARALAEQGADVAITSRQGGPAAEAFVAEARGSGRRAWSFVHDAGDTAGAAAFAARAWDETGGIDVLVNNAGIAFFEPFEAITPERWRRVMAVNVEGPFFLAQAIAKRMIAAGVKGRIINVSSTNAMVGEAGLAHYNASKGAIDMVTRSLAIELGRHGITVNSINPGLIETEIGGDFSAAGAAFRRHSEAQIPLEHRWGSPEDCAGAVAFLASAAAGYVTGQNIVIDGGLIAQQFPRDGFYENAARVGPERPP
jgi:NAD(P)-dependent dehydrogenase (short-subunit alcohol dehydrogenase family)